MADSILFVTYNALPYTDWVHVGAKSVYVAAGKICCPTRENHDVAEELSTISKSVLPDIKTFSKVVIYIGAKGSENAINLVRGLPAERVVFVTCDCDLSEKRSMFDDAGFTEAEVVLCECRGTKTMIELVTAYLHQQNLTLAYGECTAIAKKTKKRVLTPA